MLAIDYTRVNNRVVAVNSMNASETGFRNGKQFEKLQHFKIAGKWCTHPGTFIPRLNFEQNELN